MGKHGPQWADGAAAHLATLLTGEEIAFEWGSGRSTPWLANRVKRVYTVEHDPKWRDQVTAWTQYHGNVQVIFAEMGSDAYVRAPLEIDDQPNLWLIDGFNRLDCINVLSALWGPGDLIVLDDALDYAEWMLEDYEGITRFALPHPHAGIPINHKKYGHYRNTDRKIHADTKETWVLKI